MKVASNVPLALSSAAKVSSRSGRIRSILLRPRMAVRRALARPARIARLSSSMPFCAASTSSSTRSASAAPCQAARTIERSSRRRGWKMPGVSTNTSWAAPWIAMPSTRLLVVCTLGETIETLAPTRRLTSVDLPALGAPSTATKPKRRAAGSARGSAGGSLAPGSATPVEQVLQQRAGRRGGGRPLRAGAALGRREAGDGDPDDEGRVVRRPRLLHRLVGWQLQAAGLRPFLQRGPRVLWRRQVGLDRAFPVAGDEGCGGGQPAIEIERPDHRLAAIGEQAGIGPAAGLLLAARQPEMAAEPDRGGDPGEAVAAHQ